MRADVEIPYTSLRSTVYCQSLPVPLRQKPRTIGFRGSKKTNITSRSTNSPLKVWAFQSKDDQVRNNRHKTVAPTNTQPSSYYPVYTGLDESTMHWKSWISYKEDCKTVKHDLSMYRITQDAFRKLTMQVKQANQRFNNLNGSGFKTYYTVGDQSVPVIKPSQLARSIQHTSHKMTECNPDDALTTKPITKSTKRRPHSTTVLSRRKATEVGNRPHSTTGHYQYSDADCLTPNIIGALSKGEVGDWCKEFPGPFDIVALESKPCESEHLPDFHSDSEIDVELKHLTETDLPVKEDLKIDTIVQNNPKEIKPSEEELFQKMFEYDDEEEILERQQNWAATMTPEKVNEDDIMMFDYRGFNAPYNPQEDFPEALSEPFCHMDLLELSLIEKDWRTVKDLPDENEFGIIQRLIEMARTQFNTEKWESKESIPPKVISRLQERKGWNADAALPTERAKSALARTKTDKNCSDSCIELLCAGDCPVKKQSSMKSCLRCRQNYCDGSCTEYGYHLYVRQPNKEKEMTLTKSCKSCRKSSKMNVINSNQLIMGRPKSAFATFTSTKHQSAKPKPMKLGNTPGAEDIRSAMQRLGLKQPNRPSTGKKRTNNRGRNAVIPGKSYFSQRRISLTDDPISTSAAKMNPKGLIQKKKSRHK
ncbi:uncharacterized protein [Antedon mediterranea]|uniref:uncharacterized protein n=1 Tax=Antedon mediterranea TaxID=105859 RepID=UPI003AF622CC